MAKVQSGGQKVPKANPVTNLSQFPGGTPPMGAPALKDVMSGGTVKK
jgi:hypothetical protein